jgi:maltose O-acetyltransferase
MVPNPQNPETTELEMMLSGELYYGGAPQLIQLRNRAKKICAELNVKLDGLPADNPDRIKLFKDLVCSFPEELEKDIGQMERLKKKGLVKEKEDVTGGLFIESPFRCDYGFNIYLGKNVYMNHNVSFVVNTTRLP